MKNKSYEVRAGSKARRGGRHLECRVTLGVEALVSTPSTSEVKGELDKEELRNGLDVRAVVESSNRKEKKLRDLPTGRLL